jgi:hypothetical protein
MASTSRVSFAVALLALAPALVRAESHGGSAPLDDPTLIALAVALAVSPAPQVEEGVPAEPPPAREEPQLELVATVRAKSLVFEHVPTVDVTFTGNGKRRTVWRTERTNLPARVEPGVVYRDVAVRLTLTSTMEDMAVLLRDAKSAARGLTVEPDDAPAPSPATAGPGGSAARAPAQPAAPSGPAVIVPSPARR